MLVFVGSKKEKKSGILEATFRGVGVEQVILLSPYLSITRVGGGAKEQKLFFCMFS
jgi:hypothetical protein